MKTQLIAGYNLSADQISLLPFNGATNPQWIRNHSFWFTEDGKALSPKADEYYPVIKSLSHLPE